MSNSESKRFSLRVINSAETEEILEILKELGNRELRVLSRRTNLRLNNSNFMTVELANLFIVQLLRRDAEFNSRIFADLASLKVLVFCKEVLKDSFEDPTEEQLIELTPRLVEKFGRFRTQLMYAICIDHEAVAANHATKILSETGLLPISSNQLPKTEIQVLAVPEPISAEIKQGRKAKRTKERDLRASKKAQKRENDLEHKAAQKLQKKNKTEKLKEVPSEEPASTDGPGAIPVVVNKRVHPLITRFGEDAGVNDDVSRIGNAFVRFSGDPRGYGKERPVLVIAKTSKHYVVRPIYSHARWPAGYWRAVEIVEWKEAGLSNNSYVGDETHIVKHKNLTLKGRLSLKDWNRVCLGEVNSVAS